MRAVVYILLITIVCCIHAVPAMCQYPLGDSHAVIVDMRVIKEKNLLIANLGGSIEVWDYDAKALVKRWMAEKITCIDVRNGQIAGASATGRVLVWNLETGSPSLDKQVSDKPLIAIAWVDDGSIVVGGENKSLLKISTAGGEVTSQASNVRVTTALTLGDDNTLIVGDEKGNVALYDARSLAAKKSGQPHHLWVRQIVVSDSLPSFYTASDDGKVCTWSKKEMSSSSCRKFGNWLLAADVVDFSDATKRVLAIGKRSGELIVDVAFGHYKAKLDAMITGVAIVRTTSPGITILVTTYGSGIQFWDAREMRFTSSSGNNLFPMRNRFH